MEAVRARGLGLELGRESLSLISRLLFVWVF